MSNLEDDARNFWLGPVTKVHTLGRYALLEYVQKDISNSDSNGQTFFTGYIDGKGVHESWSSIEAGIIGVIIRDKLGMNQSAATAMIFRGLGIEG